MTIQRLSIKLFFESGDDLAARFDIRDTVPLFHRLIREQNQSPWVEDMLIDVVDYAHVYEGPGILLVAHRLDIGIDRMHGKLGLTVTLKDRAEVQDSDATLAEFLATQTKAIADRLLAEPELTGLRVDKSELSVWVADRLRFEQSDQGAKALTEFVAPAISKCLWTAATPALSFSYASPPAKAAPVRIVGRPV